MAVRPQSLIAAALALALAACTTGIEIGPDGRPRPAVAKVTLFRCAFWRLPCDAR